MPQLDKIMFLDQCCAVIICFSIIYIFNREIFLPKLVTSIKWRHYKLEKMNLQMRIKKKNKLTNSVKINSFGVNLYYYIKLINKLGLIRENIYTLLYFEFLLIYSSIRKIINE